MRDNKKLLFKVFRGDTDYGLSLHSFKDTSGILINTNGITLTNKFDNIISFTGKDDEYNGQILICDKDGNLKWYK